jgi:hypothetical protein
VVEGEVAEEAVVAEAAEEAVVAGAVEEEVCLSSFLMIVQLICVIFQGVDPMLTCL